MNIRVLVSCLALSPVAHGHDIWQCLGKKNIDKLPQPLKASSEELRKLLKSHPIVRELQGEMEVDLITLGPLEARQRWLEVILEQALANLENASGSRRTKNLPPALMLVSCLFGLDTAQLLCKKERPCQRPLVNPLKLTPAWPKFYFETNLISYRIQSSTLLAMTLLNYWLTAPRPLLPPIGAWLAPFGTIMVEIWPFYKIAVENIENMERGFGDLDPEDFKRFKELLQNALDMMGRAFHRLHAYLGDADCQTVYTIVGGLDLDKKAYPNMLIAIQDAQEPLTEACEQQRTGEALMSQILAAYSVRTLHLQLLLPAKRYLDEAQDLTDNAPRSMSSEDWRRRVGGQFEELGGKFAQIVKACHAVCAWHDMDSEGLGNLHSAIQGFDARLDTDGAVDRVLSSMQRWPKVRRATLRSPVRKAEGEEILVKGWIGIVEMIRAVDTVIYLAINQPDESQRSRIIARLLAKNSAYGLRWLLPRVKALMFVIKDKMAIPEGFDYDWDQSPITLYSLSMEREREPKNARKVVAVVADDDRETPSGPRDDAPALNVSDGSPVQPSQPDIFV